MSKHIKKRQQRNNQSKRDEYRKVDTTKSFPDPTGSLEPLLCFSFEFLSIWELLNPPGQDNNPLLVSCQQILVLIYQPRKDGNLSYLRQKGSHKDSNFSRARDRTRDLVARRQTSYQLRQPRRYHINQMSFTK